MYDAHYAFLCSMYFARLLHTELVSLYEWMDMDMVRAVD